VTAWGNCRSVSLERVRGTGRDFSMAPRCDVGENNLAMKRRLLEMGWDQIPRFLMRMREIGPSDKLVFAFILNRIRDFGNGRAFPSIMTIAMNNALSIPTVKRSTAALVKIGLLVRHRRGLGKTNEYGLPDEIPPWILEAYGGDLRSQRDQKDTSDRSKRSPVGVKLNRRKRVVEVEGDEGDPTGAGCRPPDGSGAQPGRKTGEWKGAKADAHGGEPRSPQDDSGGGGALPPAEEGKRAQEGWAGASPFVLDGPLPDGGGGGVPPAHTVCAGGSRKVMPWEREEDAAGGGKRKKPRKKGMYDPEKPVSEWTGNDLVGYFREMFKRAWPGEGAPDVRIEDLGAAKRRIVWMRDEGMDIGLAKRAVDHLFANWGDGLPGRLRWKGSRPGIAIVENARLFEMLVREAQNGVATGKTADEWKGDSAEVERYQRREEIRARMIDEGSTLEQADRESRRLAGL